MCKCDFVLGMVIGIDVLFFEVVVDKIDVGDLIGEEFMCFF